MNSACQPIKILAIKLVLSLPSIGLSAVVGEAKMSAKLPGLLIGEEGTKEARGTGVLLRLGLGVGLGDFGLKILATVCESDFLVGAGVGVVVGLGVGEGVGVALVLSPLHLISATVAESPLTLSLVAATFQV